MSKVSAASILQTLGELGIAMHGDASRSVQHVRPLRDAAPGCLLYLKSGTDTGMLSDPRFRDCVILCAQAPAEAEVLAADRTIIVTSNPRLALIRAIRQHFMPARPAPGVHPTAVVDPSATIHPGASVGAYTVVGAQCVIAADVVLHPHVTLYSKVRIGRGSVVNSGCVIGADGFGYERNEAGVLEKFPHVGGVVIGEDVEVGSNTSIDRGTLGDTVIEDRVRIDNQIHISHNVRIGADSAVIAQSMLGGSVEIGAGSWIAPAAILMNQVRVGEGATVGMAAVVVKDVPAGSTVTGSPAVGIEEFRATRAALKRLVSPPGG